MSKNELSYYISMKMYASMKNYKMKFSLYSLRLYNRICFYYVMQSIEIFWKKYNKLINTNQEDSVRNCITVTMHVHLIC